MARVQLLDSTGAEPPAAALLEQIAGHRGHAFNVYRALANSPGALEGVYGLATFLWNESSLSRPLQEIVILRVARLCRCEYEWERHVPLARRAGLTKEQIAALWDDEPAASGCFDATELAALSMTEEATLQVEASAEAVDAVRRALGEQATVELLVLAGFYGMVARMLRSLAVDAEPGDQVVM